MQHGLHPLDRQLREAGFRFAALLGFSIRFLLRLLLRTLADVRAECVETRFLLVVQRIIEILECGRTIFTASSVALTRFVIARRRPGGVIA